MRTYCAVLVFALAGSAAAEPAWQASVRVAAGYGVLDETTWQYPEVDIVVGRAIGEGFVAASAGYAPLDNHTYLADGRVQRLAIEGGARVVERVRAAAALGLDFVSFHADPDVLMEHPGVDILPSHHPVLPTASVQISRPLGDTVTAGVYVLVALRALELYDGGGGDRGDARLVLGGAFLELRLR